MKNPHRANDNHGGRPGPDTGAATRYLKGKDLEILEEEDLDLDMLPEIWGWKQGGKTAGGWS